MKYTITIHTVLNHNPLVVQQQVKRTFKTITEARKWKNQMLHNYHTTAELGYSLSVSST